MANLAEGAPAPAVTLTLADESARPLAAWQGAPLVLYFYPKDDTPGCTTEAQAFSALKPEFDALGVAIVGVSKDTPQKHRKFIEKHNLQIALASDGDGAVCEAFGTWIEKSLYGRQYMGIDRATFLIDAQGKVVRTWRKVRVKGHAEDVLAAARELVG